MRFDLLLHGGEVASGQGASQADVGIVGGKIVAVGDLSGASADESIDCVGLTLLPGPIDTQVHFREPGMEHKEDLASGSDAAVLGGVTTVFEMPNTVPPTTSREALYDKLTRAEGRMRCNFAFFVGASSDNVNELAELELLPGVPGVKVFMGSSTGSLLIPDDDTLLSVLRSGRSRVAVHAEDHTRLESRKSLLSSTPSPLEHPILRDPECARLATERLLRACEQTKRPVHILHVSTGEELELIRAAKSTGLPVTAEATPQHLWFAAPEAYERLGSLAQMNPPIRDASHRTLIREALRAGLFDVLGSDHAPHTLEEKARPYPASPSGMPGVQTLLPVMLTLASQGLVALEQIVGLVCEGPARIYGISGKGRIAPGFDADVAAVDLKATREVKREWIASKCGWSPFEGVKLTGWPVHTVVGGKVAVRDGTLHGPPNGRACTFDWKSKEAGIGTAGNA